MTDSIQPLMYWPAGLTAPVSTAVAYASIPQPGQRYGIGPDAAIPTAVAELPNLTVTMPNGATLTVQRLNSEGPQSVNQPQNCTGDWSSYIDGDVSGWAKIIQAISQTLDAHLERDEDALVTPMDFVLAAWPSAMPTPQNVEINWNSEGVSVTAVMPNGATMTLTRVHNAADADPAEGPREEIGYSGDWEACTGDLPELHTLLARKALEIGIAKHLAGLASVRA